MRICTGRSRNASRKSAALPAPILAVLLLVSCTAVPPGDEPGSTSDTPAHSVLHLPDQRTTVLTAEPGAALARATSAALFESAPVVLLAAEGDEAGVSTAKRLAVRLGVPVLLDPGGEAGKLAAEIARLGPQAVLAVGVIAKRRAEALAGDVPVYTVQATPGSKKVTLPEELPTLRKPEPLKLTVLVTEKRAEIPAVATARAAGARILPIAGTDPRADPEAIAALHKQGPGTVLALGEKFDKPSELREQLEVATHGAQLPGGGQLIFPARRFVCLYGHPGAPALGILGQQDLQASIDLAKHWAAQYDPFSEIPVVPTFEIIATVATKAAGPDGDYSGESSIEELRPWVRAAREAGLYVILDLQSGRADVLAQAKQYKELLLQPHVGLAIDPEWKLKPHQFHLQQIGSVDAETINKVSAWLAKLVAEHNLPQKLLVIHQFRLDMIKHEERINTSHDEVTTLIHMDGNGSPSLKNSTWQRVKKSTPEDIWLGWKNFFDEDNPMLTPKQTMSHEPKPMMISYQ